MCPFRACFEIILDQLKLLRWVEVLAHLNGTNFWCDISMGCLVTYFSLLVFLKTWEYTQELKLLSC